MTQSIPESTGGTGRAESARQLEAPKGPLNTLQLRTRGELR